MLFILQIQLNNNFNIVTKITSNKVIYDFKIKKTLSLLYNNNSTRDNIVNKRLKYRIKVVDVIAFANVKAKIYYNTKHTLLIFRSNNRVYLHLNYNYYLFDKSSKKTLSQKYKSFLIKKRIDRLAYFLKLLSH